MVSEGFSSPQYPVGPARYQALWWNMEGITMVSEGSGPLPDRARTAEISSTLVGHGRNHEGIWKVHAVRFEEILATTKITFGPSSQEPLRS